MPSTALGPRCRRARGVALGLVFAVALLAGCTARSLGPAQVPPVQRLGLSEDAVPLAGGARLAVVRRGEGPADLLVVGASWWLPDVLESFEGFDFAAVDLRVRSGGGFGGARGGGFEQDAADVARFLARERRRGGDAPVVLAAGYHALVLLAALEQEPTTARGVVLVAPMPLVRDPHLAEFADELTRRSDAEQVRRFERLLASGRRSPELAAERRRFLLGPRFFDPARLDELLADPYAVPGVEAEVLMRHLERTLAGLGAWDFTARAQSLHIEAWVVHGDGDALPEGVAAAWAEALPRGELVRIERSGAFPWVEARERFTRLLAEALARSSSTAYSPSSPM